MPSDKYQLIDQRLGGNLAAKLLQWDDAGVSAPAMARLLRARTDCPLTGETVRQWLRRLKAERAA